MADYMHPADAQILKKILGKTEIPEAVQKEYDQIRLMRSRAGRNDVLGAGLLAVVCRLAKVKLEQQSADQYPTKPTQWAQVPVGTPVDVEFEEGEGVIKLKRGEMI